MTGSLCKAVNKMFGNLDAITNLLNAEFITEDEAHAMHRKIVREFRVALGLPEEKPSDV